MNLKIHNESIRDGQQYMILLRRSKKGIGIYLICIVDHNDTIYGRLVMRRALIRYKIFTFKGE